MSKQTTSHLLMIRPVNFGFNSMTAASNGFQRSDVQENVHQQAYGEFDGLVRLLKDHSIDVTVVNDTAEPPTPDSIFPNNWVSFVDGKVTLYPMLAENRRTERRSDILTMLSGKFSLHKPIDLSTYEDRSIFLEGTGSLVLDRVNRIAYACLSPRTNKEAIADFCRIHTYTSVLFDAEDGRGQAIYHTNVLMCIGEAFAVVCLEAIRKEAERAAIKNSFHLSGHEVIAISLEQMDHFAGNMLQVNNSQGKKFLVMSEQAFGSLNAGQINKLSGYATLLHAPLTAIETAGGGSARCMIAEIFPADK